MRLVFAGTPQTAVPSLDALLASRHDVVAVVTRPDAPAGRGRKVGPSPVARRAASAGLEVLTPVRARDPQFLDRLRQLGPDCCPMVAYGALIPQAVLDVPRHGWVNLHFSVLPSWRGAAPVQHAILHGDDVTGATTFRVVAELDAGPVYGVLTEPVRPDDTTGDLLDRLSRSGAELLVATLDGIEAGTAEPVPQPGDGVSFAPKITTADARVDWKLPARAVDRLIRACTPDPGAWTELEGSRLKLWPVSLPGPEDPEVSEAARDLAPGELLAGRRAAFAGTGSGPVRLGDVQAQGKRRMPAPDWLRGLRPKDAKDPKDPNDPEAHAGPLRLS
jgi:methionyl-tRNA formyltransferase